MPNRNRTSPKNGFLSHEEFLNRLENVTPVAEGYKAKCPLHDSKSGQNLSVTERDGKTLAHCHAEGCSFEAILKVLQGKLYTRSEVYRGRCFEYRNLAGEVVAVHKHKGAWYQPHGDMWVAKEPNNRPLYNLPDVVATITSGKTVYVLEGEKDVETARGIGIVGTTSGGANTWKPKYGEMLGGADVAVLPDNDPPGAKYADAVVASTLGTARSVKVFQLSTLSPNLPKGGDLTDYLESGGSKERLLEAIEGAEPLDPANPTYSANPTNSTYSANSKPVSVADLMGQELPDISWIVDDVLPEGVSLLAGKPKKGKSWMALQLCIAVATSGKAFGCKRAAGGTSLYLALEDNNRRMQRRLRKILQAESAPKQMFFTTQWPKLDDGGAEMLDEWLTDNPNTKLVVIDTLAKVRKPARGQAVYQEDYGVLEAMLPIAAAHQVAILVVHHLRQMPGADPQDEISGSSGLTGGVDGWMILRRTPGSKGPTLLVDGRDIEQEQEYALEWVPDTATWKIVGSAEEVHVSQERRDILKVLSRAPEPMTPKEVSNVLPGAKYDNVKYLMWAMLGDGQLLKDDKGKYRPVSELVDTTNPTNLPPPDTYAENEDPVSGVSGVSGVSDNLPDGNADDYITEGVL
jgi:hypothetical protein